MSFNIDKCQILQIGSNNRKMDYEMCGVKMKCSVFLGVTIFSSLKFSQQCNEAVRKADRILGLIKRNFSIKNKDIVLRLYNRFVGSHLEYTVQFWSPHHVKGIAKLGLQRRATKIVPSLRNISFEERLSRLNLFFL